MKYAYAAFDRAGRRREGTLDALNRLDAAEQLAKDGLFLADLAPIKERALERPIARSPGAPGSTSKSAVPVAAAANNGASSGKGQRSNKASDAPGGADHRENRSLTDVVRASHGRQARKGRLSDLAAFTRQLEVLVSTGTPLVEALEASARQTRPGPWKLVVEDLRARVERGESLTTAMEAHPQWFDSVTRSLIRAGEAGGHMPELLRRLAELTRQSLRLRNALVGAMVYPCLLISISIVVMTAMIAFVLPRFEGLFKTLGGTLPPTTQLLMDASAILRQWWMLILPALGAAIFVAVVSLRSPAGIRFRDDAILRLPRVGKVVRHLMVARIVRLLGVLLESKVQLLEALELTRDATSNSNYAALLAGAQDGIIRGESLSSLLCDQRLVPPSVVEALRSGEKAGRMGPVLISVAGFLDEDNEVAVKSISSIIEPVILISLGLAVGFVALSMFMPLFDLTSATGPMSGPGGRP
ncbi:MAG: type II secretion system F family protein [Planctomycetota bacterium]|nr:type II secretion system F family protein [Planctomycetota bacterium]